MLKYAPSYTLLFSTLHTNTETTVSIQNATNMDIKFSLKISASPDFLDDMNNLSASPSPETNNALDTG